MSTIMRLVQGSPEWHAHRRTYRNESETPAVLGVSPWLTPYQLWQQKLGLVQPEVNAPMLHGTQLEPAARAAYEARTGLVMQPLVLVDGEYSASLDGLTLGGDRILEVKCPYQGSASSLWERSVPLNSRSTTGGRCSISCSWRARRSRTCSCSTAPRAYCSRCSRSPMWERIRSAWEAFPQHVAKGRTATAHRA